MPIGELTRLLDASVSSIHTVQNLAARFDESGFTALGLSDEWSERLRDPPAAPWYVRRGGTLIAVRPGRRPPSDAGMLLAAAHTDSPGLRLKTRSAQYSAGLLRVPVEVYGSPILATWLDRELAVAGTVVTSAGGTAPTVHPVWSRRALAVIPNLAVHLQPKMNESVSYNRQDHLAALFPVSALDSAHLDENAEERLFEQLSNTRAFDPSLIVHADLGLIPAHPATTVGNDHGLIASPRIDNVAGCYSVLEAFRAADTPSDHTRVAIFFDHEEIGSSTHIGAGGAFVENVLRRYIAAVDGASEAWERSTARSVLISNDASHALHPNYSDKHDTGYAPKIGGGPVLKLSSTWRYIDEPSVAGWFIAACRDAEVPVQQFRIRSDMRAGSTIGPHVASNLALRGLDVGVPMLAMHSARETASIDDVDRLLRVLQLILERTHDEILDPNPPR